jgi:serine/threonine-protein kinase
MPSGDQLDAFQATPPLTVTQGRATVEELRPGMVLGQYRLLEHISSGGMGEVFKAVHPTMERIVAVKIMAPNLVQDPRARARFLREVRSAARLAHPNIVMAYDAAEEAGRCFLVMEYVEGRDAAALLQEYGTPPVPVACEIIRQAALGLQHAHEQGTMHRDVKPGNLVVASRRPPSQDAIPLAAAPAVTGWPAEPLVKVLDFGLARFHAGDSDPGLPVAGATPLTREGHVVGTPEFMAPEQACNSTRTDLRSDIYSLGCTFYCLLTGRPPFVGPSLLEVMVQHMQSWPVPVTRTRPEIGDGVVAVLERMLAKRPEDRYQQAGDVAAALRPWAATNAAVTESVPAAGPPVMLYPGSRPPSPSAAATTADLAAVPSAPSTESASGPIVRTVVSTARAVLGCAALFVVLLVSMLVGMVLLPHKNQGQSGDADEYAPHPGHVEGMMLVRLPAGPFEPSYAAPNATIVIPGDFELSTTEVTRAQFRAFVRNKSYATAAERREGGQLGSVVVTPDGKGRWDEAATWDQWRHDLPDDTAVVCVSWEDAVQFCNWLSGRGNLQPCYQLHGGPAGGWECNFGANGYRLPTEAEWEYAARAGDPAAYPQPEAALLTSGWFLTNSDDRPHPVGTKAKNPRGIYDLWGNVWEWCWDWHSLPSQRSPAWTGPEGGQARVVRGGGWCDSPPNSAAKLRSSWSPDHRSTDIGFRVARSVPSH